MQVETPVSVKEYLTTVYEHDCDYVDGVLEEREGCERDHSRLQALVAAYCLAHEKEWGVRGLIEQRIKISPTRFRVVDVLLVDPANREQIITSPPLLCIEVLSAEDRFMSITDRAHDYRDMGVPDVWFIDAPTRVCYAYSKTARFHQVMSGILTTSDGRFTLNVAELGE